MKKILLLLPLMVLMLSSCDLFNTGIPEFLVDNAGEIKAVYLESGATGANITAAIALLPNGGDIWVMDAVTINNDALTLNGNSNIIIKRHESYTGVLLNVTSGTLILKNIVIDGQGGIAGLGGNTEAEAPLVTVGSSATVILEEAAILQNNKNVSGV